MKLNQRSNRRSGLTIIEVLIVVTTLCLLAFLLLPHHRVSNRNPTAACQANLKQTTLAEIVWANDNDATNTFPAHRSTNYGGFRELLLPNGLPYYYRSLSNELISPRILTCPSDTRKPANDFESLTTNHLSYFLNMDVKSDAEATNVLHGDRQVFFKPAPRGRIVTITPNLSIAWANKIHENTRPGNGNISLADGSVMRANDRDLSESLLAPSRVSVQRLLFP
jgi:hypothetical protein